jgi:hypothetical protein
VRAIAAALTVSQTRTAAVTASLKLGESMPYLKRDCATPGEQKGPQLTTTGPSNTAMGAMLRDALKDLGECRGRRGGGSAGDVEAMQSANPH